VSIARPSCDRLSRLEALHPCRNKTEELNTYIKVLSLLLVCSLIAVGVLEEVSPGFDYISELAQMTISSLVTRDKDDTHK
jgi:hypothetical protein